MKKDQTMSKEIAKGVAKVLETNLKKRANTASCTLWYEPQAPEQLHKYQKVR